ncbi:MAG: response regulator, partial [Pseudomonadota bacterium]
MDQATVLLIDDEEALRGSLSQGLELSGQDVFATGTPEQALERINRGFYGVLVTDIRMPGTDGFQVMKTAFEIDPALPVVLITGHGDVPLAVEAMRAGAYD